MYTSAQINEANKNANILLNNALDNSKGRAGQVNDSWLNAMTQLTMQQLDNDAQYRLWLENNEYNTPYNQMARFKEAGLNPMLIYSQGTPGNSNSPAGYSTRNFQLSPQKDVQDKINTALNAFGVVTNMASSIAGLFEQGLDVRLKQNEVVNSDFMRKAYNYALPYEPGSSMQMSWTGLDKKLNPLSDQFDPLAYIAFRKMGNLPREYDNFMNSLQQRATGVSQETLNKFRADYQKYYNENLLPKFDEYQQGKIDLQEIEKALQEYNYTALEMIPPELRGILMPIIDMISPFVKFIFKSSTIKR